MIAPRGNSDGNEGCKEQGYQYRKERKRKEMDQAPGGALDLLLAAALERDRAAAARLGSGVGAPGHARSSPGRRGSFPSNNDPVDGPESPSQLSNHAPSGHLVNQLSPSDVSSSAPMSTSPGNGTNSLGLSRRNTHGGSSFTLAAEDNPTPQSVPPPTFGDQGNIGEKHVLVMVGFLSFPNVGLLWESSRRRIRFIFPHLPICPFRNNVY